MAPKYLEVLPKTLEAISRQNISDHLIIPLTLRASSYFFIGDASWGGLEAPPKISGLTKAMNLKF